MLKMVTFMMVNMMLTLPPYQRPYGALSPHIAGQEVAREVLEDGGEVTRVEDHVVLHLGAGGR